MMINLEKSKASTLAEAHGKRKMSDNFDLDPGLLEMVRLRVAQIHGCKGCAQGHAKKLRARGETGARLRLLKDWRREPIFSDREEAALNLTEALTRHSIKTVPGDVVQAAFLFFNESEMLCLILAILAANDWHYLKGFQDGNMTGRPPHE
jgi:AhpD family alkylhydroperoxidase